MRTMGNMKKSITADSDFAAWAAARSQKTNRSLAGARLAIPEPQKHAEIKSQAQQWGMTVEDATMTDEHNEEFLCDGTQSIDSITDMRKASGLEAMEYAEQHMPVLRDTMDSLTTRVDFSGIRIAVCLILEPKTAILLRKLKAAGAIVVRQCPNRYAIRAGQNLPDKEFRYLRTVIVTAAVYWGFDSMLSHLLLTFQHRAGVSPYTSSFDLA